MAGEPTLGPGDTGEWVAYLQQMLEYRQMGSGFEAGTYCAATEHAVRTLRQQHSLPDSDRCDEQTWQKLTAEPGSPDGQEGSSADQEGSADGEITIEMSIEDEVEAPTEEDTLTEVEQLPGNVAVS